MVGVLWGALQALFGIVAAVAAVAAIPAVVEFIEFLFSKLGQGDFWETIWAMVKAQWHAFAGLFTTVLDLDARARGEILGGVLITAILLVIEILTGLEAAGVALEITGPGILRALKATGKLGLDTIHDVAATARENVSNVYRLGKGAMHGLPHAVEGAQGLLRGEHLPADYQAAVGKAAGALREHVVGHGADIVRRDLRTAGKLRELTSGVHMHLNGRSAVGESLETEELARLSASGDIFDDRSEAARRQIARRIDPESPEGNKLRTLEEARTRFATGLQDEEVAFFKTTAGKKEDFISAYRGFGERIRFGSEHAEELEAIRGGYAIHSHPKDLSFSADDVEFMINYDLVGNSAISTQHEYIVQPGERLFEIRNAEPKPENEFELSLRRDEAFKLFLDAYQQAKTASDKRMIQRLTEVSSDESDIFQEAADVDNLVQNLAGAHDIFEELQKRGIVRYERRRL